MRYPASFPFCHHFLFPMLTALDAVPGNDLQGASDTMTPMAVRQGAAGRVMTLLGLLDGLHFDTPPASSQLGPRTTRKITRWTRVLFGLFQGTAFRSLACGPGGCDLLMEHQAPPGGATFCSADVRCAIGPTRTPHKSMTRGFDGVAFPTRSQGFFDAARFDAVGSASVLLQQRLAHATGFAQRSLAKPREEATEAMDVDDE